MTTCRPANLFFLGVVLATTLVAVGGCHHPGSEDWKYADCFDLSKHMPWHDDTPKPSVPVRVVGTWTDTILHKEGQTPQRGFGGRLLFYDRESNEPILVDGQLVVYAFDETGREPTDNRPTRRYVFPVEQIPLHKSESELGTSYSFWLPWDEVGGPQTEVSLVCRFEPKGGPVVVSEQTRHLLPGALTPGSMLTGNQPPKLPEGVPSRPAVRQVPYTTDDPSAGLAQTVSYESQPSAGAEVQLDPNRRMTTTSISLPESFRLRGGVASVRGGPSSVGASLNTAGVAGVEPKASPQNADQLWARRAGPQPSVTSPAATLARPALPFTSLPTQVEPSGVPADASWPAAQQVPANGQDVAPQPAATGEMTPLPGGLTTTVSYRFPGQPAASPYPWQSPFGSPQQTPPAQAAQVFPAPAAVTR